jgi:nucleotide-binding universal stress UspA family protein
VLSGDADRRGPNEPSSLEVARNAARHDLARLLQLEDERDTQAEYLLRASGIAGPADAIVACARELKVELIVMGKHHLGFVEQVLAGSVAEKVVRHAPCSVLIVHPEQEFVVAEPQEATATH